MHDELEIRRLNEEYIRASLSSDVAWFRDHLSEDFVCIESDGSLLDRAAFLTSAARPSELTDYRLVSVEVRFYGTAALVRAHGAWLGRDGRPGVSRYVDVYVRTAHGWRAVSAQITRPAPPA